MKQYVNGNKIIEGIYVCSAVTGGMVVISMPLVGVLLLVIAFLARRLVKQANMEDEYMTEPKVNKVTVCKIHANRATMAENKETVSRKSEHIKKAA